MAESFLLVAQQVLMLYLIMAVGFVLGKARLIDDRGSVAMSNLVMYAVSPSILVVAFQRELDMASLRNFGLVLLVALAVHILAAVSVLLVRDKDPQRQSCLRFAVVFANCGFMGYPLMSAMARQRGRVLRLSLCRRVHGAELDARRLYHDARPALPRHQADFLQPRHDQRDRRDGRCICCRSSCRRSCLYRSRTFPTSTRRCRWSCWAISSHTRTSAWRCRGAARGSV